MKAVICTRQGDPAEVLEVRDVPPPPCGPGQVRVRMLASPVNPSDLFMVRGQYGHQPPLPFTPGMEGVGVVEEGRGLLGWRVKGRRVAVLNGGAGNWAEQVVIPARQAVPVPDDLSDEQAAMFFVNPASAVAMTRYVLRVPRGAWLLQTAAGSALGRMVIRLGQRHGFRTLNVVRRPEQAEELLRLGGEAVIVSTQEDIAERARRLTDGAGVPFAIDAVGGATGSRCVEALAEGGRLLVYSTLSGEPLSFDPRTLMTRGGRVEGFWLSRWARGQGPLRMLGLFRRITALLREGVVTSEVATQFPLGQLREAVRLADAPDRSGKVLLRIGSR
ncbi:MAG: zinc-dependent alcohol dehydrogenase family protein [Gemmataceae bacterium]